MATPQKTEPQKPELVLSTYGNQIDVISLAKRIKVMVPGGSKLNDSEAQALAQVSLVTKCNPFIGEIWYIPGRGPMIGIKGARRHGNEQIEQAGGKEAFWFPDFQPCSGEDAGYKGDPKDLAAAYRCTITDSVSTGLYQKMLVEMINTLRAAGSTDPVGEAREIVGKKPSWTGYGFSTISEQSKMNKQALAMKRSEADALKRKFDIPFGAEVSEGDTANEAGETEWLEAKAEPVTEAAPKMTIEQARQVVVKVEGKDKFIGELDATRLNYVIQNSLFADKVEAAKMVLKEDFRMEPPQKVNTEQLQKELGF